MSIPHLVELEMLMLMLILMLESLLPFTSITNLTIGKDSGVNRVNAYTETSEDVYGIIAHTEQICHIFLETGASINQGIIRQFIASLLSFMSIFWRCLPAAATRIVWSR